MAQALRYNKGKLRPTLIDWQSLKPLLEVLEYGAEKYERDNWKKGMPITDISDSLMRHLISFLNGEDEDEESGISHIGHIMANAMFLQYVMDNKKEEFDNR